MVSLILKTYTSYFMLDCSPNMGGRERSASGSSGPILREFSSTFESSYWMPGSSGGGASGSSMVGMITPSGGGMKSGGRTSSKVHTTSLNKSMRDQTNNERLKIDKNYLSTLKKGGINFYFEDDYKDFQRMLANKISSKTSDFISTYDLKNAREEFYDNGYKLITDIINLINFATNNNATFLFVSTNKPLLFDENQENLIESATMKFGPNFRGHFDGKDGPVYLVNYDRNFIGDPAFIILHELAHWQMKKEYEINGGHPTGLFWPYLRIIYDLYQNIGD